MLSEKKLKQLAEAREHIQHKPLSEETKQKISKANDGNFFAVCDYCKKLFHTKNLPMLKENITFAVVRVIPNTVPK